MQAPCKPNQIILKEHTLKKNKQTQKRLPVEDNDQRKLSVHEFGSMLKRLLDTPPQKKTKKVKTKKKKQI